jgi:hypothetical protein
MLFVTEHILDIPICRQVLERHGAPTQHIDTQTDE